RRRRRPGGPPARGRRTPAGGGGPPAPRRPRRADAAGARRAVRGRGRGAAGVERGQGEDARAPGAAPAARAGGAGRRRREALAMTRPGERSDRDEVEREDARWRAAWRATPTASGPDDRQSQPMQPVRGGGAGTAPAASPWRVPLAAAALLVLALGAAALLGVNPRKDLGELAVLAGDATATVLRLPGAP